MNEQLQNYVTIHLNEQDRITSDLPDPQKNLMQWVMASVDEVISDDLIFTHQYAENDIGEVSQINVKKIYEMQDVDKLAALFLIPKSMRLDSENLNLIIPRLVVSMKDGSMFINGIEYDLRPEEMKLMDPQPKFKFLYYRSVKEENGSGGYSKYLKEYKLGWECEFDEQVIQRVMIFNIVANSITLRNFR